MPLSASIVINTFNRAESLAATLKSLRHLDFDDFEVIVVNGPSTDGTAELLAGWSGEIKAGECSEANLSMSRNVGIAMAAGDIIAFMDDDAIPEPEWLTRLIAGYDSDEVGGVGGMTFNHTGHEFQARFIVSDRFGGFRLENEVNPTPLLNFPFGTQYCAHLGTNSSFRRDALLRVGGFDEEFDYYLDETDVCLRLVDNGYQVKFVDDAFIHHKFLPSHVRNEHRVPNNWFPIIKNKAYFGIKNAAHIHSYNEVRDNMSRFVDEQRRSVDWAVDSGYLSTEDAEHFEETAAVALKDGIRKGLSQPRRLMTAETAARQARPFERFTPLRTVADGRLTVCFLSQDYPPGHNGGVARFTHDLARGIARRGHTVHVLTTGEGHDAVDLEEGVWVHRIALREFHPPGIPGSFHACLKNYNYARTMLEEVRTIEEHHRVDVIEAPIWDSEGMALVEDPEFRDRTVVSLQTTIKIGAESNTEWGDDPDMRRAIDYEEFVLGHARRLHAISLDIIKSVRQKYSLKRPDKCFGHIPLGIRDRAGDFPRREVRQAGNGELTALFVGRLERRKGVDVLLGVIPGLLKRHPGLRFVLAGNDAIAGESGATYKEEFLLRYQGERFLERVEFAGRVSDEELYRRYAGCDLFVAPSRYESFGLVFLEAMMFGKPVIGCRAGGMVEVIEDGFNGLLAEPGDAATLEAAIERLVTDADLRKKLGAASRRRFVKRFTDDAMVNGVLDFFRSDVIGSCPAGSGSAGGAGPSGAGPAER